LLPGVQLSSLVILNEAKLSLNHYPVARLWAQFVYFDVPEYEQSLQNQKYVFTVPTADIISSRRLLQSSVISLFRFERTGHTSYFLLDNYIQLLLVFVAWITVGAVSLLAKKWKGLKSKQETAYFVLHKVH
jgi:hypothetical protein